MQPMPSQPLPKKSSGAGLWALLGCLGCFGLFAVVGAIGLAFFLVRSAQDDPYGTFAFEEPYALPYAGDPYADPYAQPVPSMDDFLAPQPAPVDDTERVHVVPIEGSAQRGPDDALVTIVAFSDFQCPFCGRARSTLDQIERHYGSDVRIVFKHYPLPFHLDAGPAAEAALEVRAQRGDAAFWRMHDIVFENQHDLSREALVRYARQAGASGTGVSRALAQGTHRAALQRDMDLGQRVGPLGTPTFFINGKKLEGAQPFESFQAAIDAELAHARALVATGVAPEHVYETITLSAR